MTDDIEALKDGVSALGLNAWQHGQVCELIDRAVQIGESEAWGRIDDAGRG